MSDYGEPWKVDATHGDDKTFADYVIYPTSRR